MKKISIAMYSTVEGNSYKGAILEPLISELKKKELLGNVYGLKNIQNKKSNHEKKIHLSIIPLVGSSIVKRISRFFSLPNYFAYLAGEILTGIIFAIPLLKDTSKTIILKPRPYMLTQISFFKKKEIVIDSGEMHPRYYQNECTREYNNFKIRKKSIFSDEYSVKQIEKSLMKADLIITLTKESEKSYLTYGIPQEKLVCVNLGMNSEYERKTKTYEKSKKMVFFITAHHSIIKGTHRVINAWMQSRETYKSELIIIGSIHDDLKEYLSTINISSNVKFSGALKMEEITNLYEKYNSVGIMTSFSEGYSRSVVEYLQNGMPVIVSKVSTCDMIKQDIHGFIVDPTDEKSIQIAIEKYINHSCYYETFSKNIGNLKIETTKNFANEISNILSETEKKKPF